ncbi:MAG: hypothetical protein ACSHYC_24220 [Alphaproteobacteria bacterium]
MELYRPEVLRIPRDVSIVGVGDFSPALQVIPNVLIKGGSTAPLKTDRRAPFQYF